MYTRIKLLREKLKMSQKEFALRLGIGLSTLGMIEVGKRELLERHINLICKVFDVNENWLRNGTEPMFIKKHDEPLIDLIQKEFNLSPLSKKIVNSYLHMDNKDKATFESFFNKLMTRINNDNNMAI